MRWKVNIFFVSIYIMSTYGQMVLIDNHLNLPTNKTNESDGDSSRDGEENIVEDSKSHENRSSEIVIPDNGLSENEGSDSENVEGEPIPEEIAPSNEESRTAESNDSESVPELVTEESIISTSHGPVQGHLWKESPNIISFYDIPYGRITSLFQAPQMPKLWEQTHHPDAHSKLCPQLRKNEETEAIEVTEDIDCLTLSVFVPREAKNASVLFYIHDGSFISGSGDPSIYGPDYLLDKGIILILPNYRLGPLGFLCLQNEIAPGNAALKDLTLALNWTKSNIAAFGGDPDNIVVSGDGSSGALAGYLSLSPASRDYVSKVIADSGSVISYWAIDRDPIATASILAEKIRSSNEEQTFNDDLFEEVEIDKLILGSQGIHLRPCVENGSDPFLSQTPWYILHNQKIETSFMMGSASFAGLHEALSHDATTISQLNEDFANFFPDDLIFEDGLEEKAELAKKIKTQYFGDNDIKENTEELALLYTDASFLSPMIRTARALVGADATVYFYEFAFVGAFNRESTTLGSEVNGSARGDIVGYLFTQGELPENGSNEEEMVDVMTDLWISFIKHGIPSFGVEWGQLKSTSEDEEEWLWIGSETKPRKGLHVDRLELWTKIYEAHFVERNSKHGLTQNPALLVAAIYLVGLFPKTIRVSR